MLDQYRFSRASCALTFHQYELTGADVAVFLQRQSTFDVPQIGVSEFHLMSFLDPHGKVEFYCWTLRLADSFKLLVPIKLQALAIERLERFLISEDVTITDQGVVSWTLTIGPETVDSGFRGIVLEEKATLFPNHGEVPESLDDLELLRLLNGWPSFSGEDFHPELVNNLRLYDLSVSEGKGCYPGQETVSKIATRRGAAYSPVLIELTTPSPGGEISIQDKKIGTAQASIEWKGNYYLPSTLLRDFRVEGMMLNFQLNGHDRTGTVRYYPLLSGDPQEKARELFYEASSAFAKNDYDYSEVLFRKALRIDPSFADAYEALGVLLGRQERFAEALEVMQRLSKVDPTSVMAHTNMSLYLMRLGRIDEAEEEKSKATVKSFQRFGLEAKEKAKLQEEQRVRETEWAKRESMFLQVLEIDADDALANFGLGSLAIERGEWERAEAHLQKVLATDPNYSVAYLALGKALVKLGKVAAARDTWATGIKIAAKRGDLMPANQMQVELDRL